MPTSQARFSAARRGALERAAAVGLSLLIPACNPSEPARTAPRPNRDLAEGALRLDLRQWRRNGAEDFTLERLRFEQVWPGRRTGLTDALDLGEYRLSLHDPARNVLIFRQGFDTNLSPTARSGTTQVSVRFPMPQRAVRVDIEKRAGKRAYQPAASISIDPDRDSVDRATAELATRIDTLFTGGGSESKIDLAILGDGYLESEYPKFAKDAERAAGYLFSVEPFKTRRSEFNVRSVFAASAASGVTDPHLGVKRDTVFRSAYYTGGSERSLAEGDNYAVREVAAAVPYEFLLILANARRYGGSSYFRGPAVAAIDSAAARYLVIHEFAHAFAGLADEYYVPAAAGPVVSGDPDPWQPNVAARAERANWKDLVTAGTGEPARWNKTEYDTYFADYIRRYDKLRESGAEETVVEKFLDTERMRQTALLMKGGSGRRVGYFEGASGYANGVFRSEVDCIMFSLQTNYFCAACSAAIERMIDEHCR